MQGTATQWLPVICQGMGGIGVEEIMPLVSYALARRVGRGVDRTSDQQLTVPLPKNNRVRARLRGLRVHRWAPALAAAVLWAQPASGQRVLGPWEDATIAPRGMIRAGIGVHFGTWDERFARLGGRRESLGADFTRDSLGAALLPGMGTLSASLDALVGSAGPLTLGTLDTRLVVTEAVTPISLEYGLTSRVGLQVVIPYVKNHVHVSPHPNASGNGATLGLNPAWSLDGARTENDRVVTNLADAASTLTNELARCLGLMEASCAAINADRAGASALVTLAGETATSLAAVFGTSSVSGSAFAPLAGSALQQAVNARLTTLSDDFAAFLGAAPGGQWIAARPVAASLLAAADLNRLVGDSAFGIAGRELSDYEHSNVGDIEVGAKVLLLDTFGNGATTADLPRAGAMRLAVAGIYRLPTAQLDLASDFTDIGTGDRQADLELRGFADVALGRRAWTSAVLRYGIQRPDHLVRRIPTQVGDPFPEFAREHEVSRDLGDFLELEVAPRYTPNDEFSFSAQYRYRTKPEDTWRGTFDVTSVDGTPMTIDAAVLGIGTAQTEQHLGLAITFSTLRGYALRQARWPLEVSLVHTTTLGGKGGVPARTATGIAVRLYKPLLANPLRRN